MKDFGFVLFVFYSTLAVEQRIEALVYDFSSFLVSIGDYCAVYLMIVISTMIYLESSIILFHFNDTRGHCSVNILLLQSANLLW